MKKIIVIPNLVRDVNGVGTKKVLDCLKQNGITAVMDNSLKIHNFDCAYADIDNVKDADMAIIIGGDGTILASSKRYINTSTPVLGINHGNMGYLTELEKDDIKGLESILLGNYIVDKRPVIKVEHNGNDFYCINEASIHRGNSPKMLDMEIIIENVAMHKYRADGLIVATSSGSTAYSLSAGGPIINPLVNAFVITPVCPQNLYLRSMVVPADDRICVKLQNSEAISFSVDGELITELTGNNIITMTNGGYLPTVRRNQNSFYNKIKTKIFEKEI